MYHIGQNKRVMASADRLVAGLTECLKRKNMSEISVSDLASAANVSRATFYRLFDTPIDVLEYASDVSVEKTIKDYKSAGIESSDEFALFSFRYWYIHHELIEAMFNCNRMDIVMRSLERQAQHLLPVKEHYFTPSEQEYLRMGAVGAMGGLLKVWLRHDRRETPEQMYALYKKFCTVVIENDELVSILK